MSTNDINTLIQKTVRSNRPDAQIILFGSRARGTEHPDSDWDVIVIIDEDHITPSIFMSVGDPLYDLADQNGIEINPVLYTRKQWEHGNPTLFRHNIQTDGILL